MVDKKTNVELTTEALSFAKPMLAVRAYVCRHCGKVVNRESSKQWIKSYCDETGKNVRLMLVKA